MDLQSKGNIDGIIVKHKDQLVVKGYVQKECLDYEDIFSPIAQLEMICSLLYLCRP